MPKWVRQAVYSRPPYIELDAWQKMTKEQKKPFIIDRSKEYDDSQGGSATSAKNTPKNTMTRKKKEKKKSKRAKSKQHDTQWNENRNVGYDEYKRRRDAKKAMGAQKEKVKTPKRTSKCQNKTPNLTTKANRTEKVQQAKEEGGKPEKRTRFRPGTSNINRFIMLDPANQQARDLMRATFVRIL